MLASIGGHRFIEGPALKFNGPLLAAAAVALAYAVIRHPNHIAILVVVVALAVVAVSVPRGTMATPSAWWLAPMAAACVFIGSGTVNAPVHSTWLVAMGLLFVAVLALGAHREALPFFVASFLAMGVLFLTHSAPPGIDVWLWHGKALDAMAHGENPYSLHMPNMYSLKEALAYYGEDGRLAELPYGFPYPPVSLLLAAPGHFLFGDYRYSCLASMGGSALLMGYARPSKTAFAAAVLFLLLPLNPFVLEQGWTEPFVFLLFSAVMFVACRSPNHLWVVAGLWLASKQYLVLLAPLLALLMGWAELARAITLAAVLVVSWALWGPVEFLRSLLAPVVAPFRADSLSVAAWAVSKGLNPPPGWATPLIGLVSVVGVLIRAVATPSGFAASCAFVLLATFQAGRGHANYYWIAASMLLWAVAVGEQRDTRRSS